MRRIANDEHINDWGKNHCLRWDYLNLPPHKMLAPNSGGAMNTERRILTQHQSNRRASGLVARAFGKGKPISVMLLNK